MSDELLQHHISTTERQFDEVKSWLKDLTKKIEDLSKNISEERIKTVSSSSFHKGKLAGIVLIVTILANGAFQIVLQYIKH